MKSPRSVHLFKRTHHTFSQNISMHLKTHLYGIFFFHFWSNCFEKLHTFTMSNDKQSILGMCTSFDRTVRKIQYDSTNFNLLKQLSVAFKTWFNNYRPSLILEKLWTLAPSFKDRERHKWRLHSQIKTNSVKLMLVRADKYLIM